MKWIAKAGISNLYVSYQIGLLSFVQAQYLDNLVFMQKIRKMFPWVEIAQIRKPVYQPPLIMAIGHMLLMI